MRNNRMAMFLLGATLALGFAFSAYVLAGALVKMRQENTIRVKGYAQTQIKSDNGVWDGSFIVRNNTLASCYAGLEAQRTKVKEMIDKCGFDKSAEINFYPVSIGTLYQRDENGNMTNTIEAYTTSQTVEIQSGQIEKIQAVSKAADDLISQGIEFHSNQPVYTYSGIEKIKLDLLAKASANATERAKAIAQNTGGNVGRLSSASQGVFQITGLNSTDVSDEGTYDTSSVDKMVKAVVTLEFHVEK